MAAQVPDRIIFNQEYLNLFTNPLEAYWMVSGLGRPRFIPSEDCRRGYVATWEIKDNQLFLREVEGRIRRSFALWGKRVVAYSLGKLFGKKRSGVKADWFSGKLRIPLGNMTLFDDNGYNSRFEKEVIITVTEGNLNRVVIIDSVNKRLTVEGNLGDRLR